MNNRLKNIFNAYHKIYHQSQDIIYDDPKIQDMNVSRCKNIRIHQKREPHRFLRKKWM